MEAGAKLLIDGLGSGAKSLIVGVGGSGGYLVCFGLELVGVVEGNAGDDCCEAEAKRASVSGDEVEGLSDGLVGGFSREGFEQGERPWGQAVSPFT